MTARQQKVRARAARKKRQRLERQTKNVKAKRAKRAQGMEIKSFSTALRELPEGTLVETLGDGTTKLTQMVPRTEADAARQHLLEVAEANGLTPVEGS